MGSFSILVTFAGRLVGGSLQITGLVEGKLVTATAISEPWPLLLFIYQATTHARRNIGALLYLHFECKIPRPPSPRCNFCRMQACVYRRKELAKHETEKHVADGRWCFEVV